MPGNDALCMLGNTFKHLENDLEHFNKKPTCEKNLSPRMLDRQLC